MRLLVCVLAVAALTACGKDATEPENPVPGITSLSPTTVEAGTAQLLLSVEGSDFVEGTQLRFGGVGRAATVRSSTRLEAVLTTEDLATPGQVQVQVWNPAPGGGPSNAMVFTVGARTFPGPAVTGIDPDHAMRGDGPITIAIEGSGFTPQSAVWVLHWRELETTFVSTSRLEAELTADDLLAPGTLLLQVVNPPPGGGASGAVIVEVRNPAPTISALASSEVPAGQMGYELQVAGTGFFPETEVRVNGAARPTQLLGPGSLAAVLADEDLQREGTLEITTYNPEPGGGTSSPRSLTVVLAPPELTLLPSRGAQSGGPGFDLIVHGAGFVETSVVRWNGADRPTQYLGGTRLSAAIGAADVATTGTAQVSVRTPGAGGGTSAGLPLTIRAAGPPTASVQRLGLHGGDLAWDPIRGRIYVSVRAGDPEHANTIVAVDPLGASVTESVFVGSDPDAVARSDDGQYLYVGLNGASAVRRVLLGPLAPSIQWPLAAGEIAGDLEVVPGRAGTVVVSRHRPDVSPALEAVTVYDDGVARAISAPGHTGPALIEFLGSPTVFYGYNNQHTGFEFFTLALESDGVHVRSVDSGLIGGFDMDIAGAAGRIYGRDGHVVDAERRVLVGSLTAGEHPSALTPDPETGRAYLIVDGGIAVYDLNTFQALGTIPVPDIAIDHPTVRTRLVRWGEDGLAVLDADELILVRSPIVAR